MPGANKFVLDAIANPGSIFASLFIAPRPTSIGGAVRAMDILNANRRAAFLINAVTRVSRQTGPAAAEALDREATYARQHIEASQARERAARIVAEAARTHGNLLGWKAIVDSRTSEECLKANGRNFDARQVPGIGYPGSSHPTCRCRPTKPYNTPHRVEDIIPERTDWRSR